MSNPSTPSSSVPTLKQLGLAPSADDGLQSLREGRSQSSPAETLPPGWNTAAQQAQQHPQQAALPRHTLTHPEAPFGLAHPSLPQPQLLAAPPSADPPPNVALASLLHGTIAPALIPNPSQFLLRNFGIDVTGPSSHSIQLIRFAGARPRWVGLAFLRNYPTAPQQQQHTPRGQFAPASLTQFLHSDFEQQHHTASAMPTPGLSAPPARVKHTELKRKEYTPSEHTATKRHTAHTSHASHAYNSHSHAHVHAQAMSAMAAASEEPDWVPPNTGRDPFHERVGSIPLVDLRAQPMSYLQDFVAQMMRDVGKTPVTTALATSHSTLAVAPPPATDMKVAS